MASVINKGTSESHKSPPTRVLIPALPDVARKSGKKSFRRSSTVVAPSQSSSSTKASQVHSRADKGPASDSLFECASPLGIACQAMRTASAAFCKALGDMSPKKGSSSSKDLGNLSPIFGSAGRSLAKKVGSMNRRTRKAFELQQPPKRKASTVLGNVQNEFGELHAESLGPKLGRQGTIVDANSTECAGAPMTSAFVRFVYKEARHIHEQRCTFQARAERKGPLGPKEVKQVLLECVHDLKFAIRLGKIAQCFIYTVSSSINSRTGDRSRPVTGTVCDEVADSAWADLLISMPDTPCSPKQPRSPYRILQNSMSDSAKSDACVTLLSPPTVSMLTFMSCLKHGGDDQTSKD